MLEQIVIINKLRDIRDEISDVDFISEEGAVLYSRTFPIIAESALMAETWVANILAVLEYQTSTLSDIFRQAGREAD